MLFDEVRERTWYVWFDEVYPPTPPVPEIKCKLTTIFMKEIDVLGKLVAEFDLIHR